MQIRCRSLIRFKQIYPKDISYWGLLSVKIHSPFYRHIHLLMTQLILIYFYERLVTAVSSEIVDFCDEFILMKINRKRTEQQPVLHYSLLQINKLLHCRVNRIAKQTIFWKGISTLIHFYLFSLLVMRHLFIRVLHHP